MFSLTSRRWWALGALTLAVLAVGLDGTILSVALPTLATALHASESDLQWFQSGYLLVLAAGMLPAGLLGDRYGRKKVLLAALALFGAGSAACALSPSPAAFIAARAVLGVAGAGVIVMALSGLTVLFDEEERPRAVGIWAAANFLALPVGPILGGWLLTNAWWGWVFLLNVPVAAVGLVATLLLVPESRATQPPDLDPVGMITSVAGLVAVTYGLVEAGERGWTAGPTVLPIAAGLLVLTAFVLWERRLGDEPGSSPILDLTLFRSPAFTWGVVLTAVGVLAMVGALFTMPQFFQGVMGTDAMGSGVRLLPLIAGLVAGAVPADRLALLAGPRRAAALGFLCLGIGLLLGALTGTESSVVFIAFWMALVGAGMGLAMATAASAALSQLPAEKSGVGSAVMQALQKVGGPLGAAVLGSVLSSAYRADLHVSSLPAAVQAAAQGSIFGGIEVARNLHSAPLLHAVRSAFVHGMDAALAVSAGIAAIGLLLTLIFFPGRASMEREPVEAMEREAAAVVGE